MIMSFDKTSELLIFLYGKDNIIFNTEPITFKIFNSHEIIKGDENHNIFWISIDEYKEVFYYDQEMGVIERTPIKYDDYYQIMHPFYRDTGGLIDDQTIFVKNKLFAGLYYDMHFYTTINRLNKALTGAWETKSENTKRKYMLLKELLYEDVVSCIIGRLCLLEDIIKN